MKQAICLILFAFCVVQVESQDLKPAERYMHYLESDAFHQGPKARSEQCSGKNLKIAARLIYEANEDDPVAVRRGIQNKNRLADSAYSRTGKAPLKAGAIEWYLLNAIDTSISKRMYVLTSSPYLMRIFVDTVFQSVHVIGGRPMRLGTKTRTNAEAQYNIAFTVLDVFAGIKTFPIGSKGAFYYLAGWRRPLHYFVQGDTCLLGLEPRITSSDSVLLSPRDYGDHQSGYYPIKNGNLLNPENTFKFGLNQGWNEVERGFWSDISVLKSW